MPNIKLSDKPKNIVTESDPDLVVGSKYALFHSANNPDTTIFITEASSEPDAQTGLDDALPLLYGNDLEITIGANGWWCWTFDNDVSIAIFGVE